MLSQYFGRILIVAPLLTFFVPVCVTAQPVGSFFAVIDSDQGISGDSPRSVVFYNFAIQNTPLFSVYTPWENGIEDPDAMTVNPANGDVYLAAFDSGSATVPPGTDTTNDGMLDSIGDIDLFRINFQATYNDWTTNQGMNYVTYYSQPGFPPTATSPQLLTSAVSKIGEVARSQNGPTYNRTLEFVDPTTLILLDNDSGTDTAPTDHEIRAIKQVAATNGSASYNLATHEGGYNNGTTESWESTILGRVNLDGATASEPKSIAFINKDGVMGVWTGDSDILPGPPSQPVGDDIAFFQITNLNGTAGNGYREFKVGLGPSYPTDFQLDDNPVLDPNGNTGAHDKIFVNPKTGKLVIIESGFDDTPQDEISVVTREINNYNDTTNSAGGQIDFGSWGYTQAAPAGNDDPTFLFVGAHTVYDSVHDAVYVWDWDGNGGLVDVWKIDLTTGATSLVSADVDNIFLPNSGNNDKIAFFFLPHPGDFDLDGDVDGADFVAWQTNFPTASGATLAQGDADGDGDVDGADFVVWQTNFPFTPSSPGVSPVPEPAAWMLAGLALPAAAWLRRKRGA